MTTSENTAVTQRLSSVTTDQVRNFKFLVEFVPVDSNQKFGDKFGKMGFVSVSGLTIATESIAYREGGYNTNFHQLPGQSSFTPITLSKGISLGQKEHSLWMKRLFSMSTGTAQSGVGAEFRCNVEISVLTHPNPKALDNSSPAGKTVGYFGDQHASIKFKVYNAWITNIGYSNLDAGGNTLMVEEMTLVHEGFDVSFADAYTKTADDLA
jgi:phage tail-like protein